MLSKNQIKHLRSLRLKKNRYAHRQFLVEGETVVAELLNSPPSQLELVACTSEYYSRLSPQSRRHLGSRLVECDAAILRGISTLDTPPSVLALLNMPSQSSELTATRGLSIFLDGIRDPGNLGTIIRVADWFGLPSVFLTDDCVDVYNPKTIQASMGSFARVHTRVASLASLRAVQPDLPFLGTCIDNGLNALRFEWPSDGLLIIGSESHGIRPENSALIATWLSIPRGVSSPTVAAGAVAESLNAAVATGILAAAHARGCH